MARTCTFTLSHPLISLPRANYGSLSSSKSIESTMGLEIPAAGTAFAATAAQKKIFENLIDASEWMIYANNVTGVLHWDLVRILG